MKKLLRNPVILLVLGLSTVVNSQTEPQTTLLEQGKSIEQSIAGGETHAYDLKLAQGMYALIAVDQKEINLAVSIVAADGQKLRVVDLTSIGFAERFSLIAPDATTYRVEVRPPNQASRRGGYAIMLEEVRPATDRDRASAEAEKLVETGMQLLIKANATSQKEAAATFEQSIPLWRAARDITNEARALYMMGYAFNQLGEYQKAIDVSEQGLQLLKTASDPQTEAYLFDTIGTAYNSRGARKVALGFFLKALPLRSEKDPVGLGNTLNNLGMVYSWMGDAPKALEYMERVASIMEKMDEPLKYSTVLGNICLINADLGHYKKAIEICQRALKIKHDINDRGGQGTVTNTLANTYARLGDYQKAFELYDQARTLHQGVGARDSLAVTLNNIGWAYAQLGEYGKAVDFYRQVLQQFKDLGNKYGYATTLNNIGANYVELKDFRKALEVHLEVLPLRSAKDDPNGRGITLGNIANAYFHLGDKQKARENYTEALALHRLAGNQRQLSITLRNFGVFYRDEGETSTALDHLREARTISTTIGDRNVEASVLAEIAKLELNRGNLAEARKLIEEAIGAIESLRVNLKSYQLRSSFLALARKYYEFNIDVLMRLHRQRPNEGFAIAALHVSEKSRARSLLEMLRESRAQFRQGVDPSLIERENYLQRLIADKADQQTRLLSGKHTEDDAAVMTKELNALITEYDQVQSRIRQASPRYAALIEPQPIDVEGIKKRVVDADTLLLEYALGDERSFLWAVTPDSVKSFELPGRATIEQAARRFYQLLTERGVSVSGETVAQRKVRLERADSEYAEAAAALSRILLAPVGSELKQKRLAIVAEGVLQYVPFSALPSPLSGATPLIVDHEIVTLPSASVLAVLRDEKARRQPAGKAVAVLADPVFSANDPRLAKNGGPAVVDNSSLIDAYRSAAESGLGTLVRLRFSRQEAEEIARLAGDKRNLKALDFAANRSIVTDSKLSDYRIVHFATHGLINNQHPDLSGIVLSLVDEQGRPQNGFLRLYDIYNLKLDADLVVLSACQTALGKEIKGEGLIGLTRGFMYAGAPRVVASLWRIDDRATADIMSRFYAAMLKDGLRPAAALRAAQVSMLRERRWQSPHYWAAFTIQGEWRLQD